MKYVRIPPKRLCHESIGYQSACPTCHAPAGFRCATTSGERRWRMHFERSAPVVVREPLPDLSGWWRSMKVYEGAHPLARPEGLRVP